MTTTTHPIRVIRYRRVSTAEQADSGAGLSVQQEELARASEREGYVVVKDIADKGFTAGSLDRPGIRKALAMLERGEADALMVSKLDRLSRSVLDFAQLMETARKQDWRIIILDLGLDTATAAGEMMAGMLAVFAQFERRLIGQRTKDALAAKKAAGVRLGRPVSLSEDTAQRILDLDTQGLTAGEISRTLNRERVPTSQGSGHWHPATVRRILARIRPTAA